MSAFRRILLVIAGLLLAAVPTAFAGTDTDGAGFRTLQLIDPVSHGAMQATVFYPASHPTVATDLGPYRLDAESGVQPATGKHPLILISHGSGGSRLGHHDLAEYLAHRGFIVAAVEHPGDNYQDQSGIGTDRVLLGRPLQISALISALLRDPAWRPLIDRNQIGMAGFSAGGYTGLMLAGARPDGALVGAYCRRHPADAAFCSRPATALARPGQWGPTADPRVRAVFLMAPLSLLFDAEGLASVHIPVFLYMAESDHILIPSENGAHIRPWLKQLAGYQEIKGADHYVFLAPCTPTLQGIAPELCTDPVDIDRTAVHARINADALQFFRQELAR